MKHELLISAGWFLSALGFYVAVLVLDVYWNVINWRPRWDGIAGGLLLWISLTLAAIWCLAKTPSGRAARLLSLIMCLALLGVAVFAVSAEPITEGLLGRDASSPWWYRTGRVLLMSVPLVLWSVHLGRPGKGAPE